jgi:3-oxoacyl-[acyl-carrier protein] reductase
VRTLHDRIAIVTGAAQGIGESIALEFAAEGARVAIADINFEGAQRVAALAEANGGAAMAVDVDVTQEASIGSMVKTVVAKYGSVNILVNNAGIYPRLVWHEMTVEQWDHIQAVNLRSCFLCSREVFPYFKTKMAGKIINLSSVTSGLDALITWCTTLRPRAE